MQIVQMQFVVMGIDRVVDWKRYVGGTELCRGHWEIRYLKVTYLFLHMLLLFVCCKCPKP